MSFFKNLFKGNKEQDVKKEQIVPLTNGELVNISQVPDEVFSSKMMGDGFAMKTSDGIIVSPVEGTIVTVFPTCSNYKLCGWKRSINTFRSRYSFFKR